MKIDFIDLFRQMHDQNFDFLCLSGVTWIGEGQRWLGWGVALCLRGLGKGLGNYFFEGAGVNVKERAREGGVNEAMERKDIVYFAEAYNWVHASCCFYKKLKFLLLFYSF